MKCEKFLWVIFIQFTLFKDCWLTNTTENISIAGNETTTFAPLLLHSSDVTTGVKNLELLQIFHGQHVTVIENVTVPIPVTKNYTIDHLNVTRNDTSNLTVTAQAIASQESSSNFRLESTGAIAAGIFLISAVVGYFGCVGYRRFMQKKYGDSQMVAGDDVYDTSDLRYFEI